MRSRHVCCEWRNICRNSKTAPNYELWHKRRFSIIGLISLQRHVFCSFQFPNRSQSASRAGIHLNDFVFLSWTFKRCMKTVVRCVLHLFVLELVRNHWEIFEIFRNIRRKQRIPSIIFTWRTKHNTRTKMRFVCFGTSSLFLEYNRKIAR